jgi:hypothetical protein
MSHGQDTCSFCGLAEGERDVGRLMGGPRVFVCNACIDLCRQIIPEDDQATLASPSPDLVCAFCGMGHRRRLVAGPKLYFCDECVVRLDASSN